jgi:hypothetical protein
VLHRFFTDLDLLMSCSGRRVGDILYTFNVHSPLGFDAGLSIPELVGVYWNGGYSGEGTN